MPARLLGLLLLLPALLCGPVLGGTVVWLHAHGAAEGHAHVLASAHEVSDHASHDAWHAAQHRREHGDDAHEREPRGLRIEIPEVLDTAPHGASVVSLRAPPAPHELPAALAASLEQALAGQVFAHPDSPPPRADVRSAVVALIRSSHALLI